MYVLTAFLLGTLGAFFGILLPGMLNMTAVSISVTRGRRAGMHFVSGTALTTALQAFAAFGLADYLRKHPEILERIHGFALFIFVVLAGVFIHLGRRGGEIRVKKISGRKHFGGGVAMAFLNALSLIYFFALGTVLVSKDLVRNGILSVVFFSFGAGLGAFLMFWLYVRAADYISRNATWLTRNINYVIGGFFVFLAVLQAYNMWGVEGG